MQKKKNNNMLILYTHTHTLNSPNDSIKLEDTVS